MPEDEKSEAEKIILKVKNGRPALEGSNKKRGSDLAKEIFSDICKLRAYTKSRISVLEKKKNSGTDSKDTLTEEEKNELSLLKKDIPYKTYLKLLPDEEVNDFLGIDNDDIQIGKFNIILEEANLRPDRAYFWMLDFVMNKFHLGYDKVIKTEDSVVFGAMSQFGNQHNQVRGGKQQIAQTYLKTISEVMRSLFPLLYEIKQSDELLAMYDAALKLDKYKHYEDLVDIKNRSDVESYFAAERTLRDKWASEVDGGKLFTFSKPQSQQGPGYVLLPHWFFSVKVRYPKKNEKNNEEIETWPKVIQESIDLLLKNKSINQEVSNVIGNFLLRFKIWQQESYKQLKATRDFKVSYLRQQYANIRLYIDWLKPMLASIHAMSPKLGRHSSYNTSAKELISLTPEKNPNVYNMLDTNQLFLEFIAYKEPKGENEKYYQILMVSLSHRTASLTFDIGGQNQNIPFGTNDIKVRGFVWTKEQFEVYLRQKENSEFDILESLYDSMSQVREQIEKYLKQEIDVGYEITLADKYPENHPDKTAKIFKSLKENVADISGIIGPFKYVLQGFSYAFVPITSMFAFNPKEKSKTDLEEFWHSKNYEDVKGKLKKHVFLVYDVYKRANRLTVW